MDMICEINISRLSILRNNTMNQDFRIQAIERLHKIAGMITDKVKQKLQESQKNYAPAGISLNYPGTSVIWPGPQVVHDDGTVNILFFFRGGNSGIMNQSGTNAIVVNADAGSAGGGPSRQAYGNAAFVNKAVQSILDQLKKKLNREDLKLGKLGFAGWSGGYDPIHGILSDSANLIKQPDYVGVFDGMHHGAAGKPDPKAMQTWLETAQKAAKGGTQFVVTHTAVQTPYASSTDTSNWLVQQMGMQRQSVQQWSGKGVKPASIAQNGNFQVVQLYDTPSSQPGNQHMQAQKSAPEYLPNWS
jgi:hypothetical protein